MQRLHSHGGEKKTLMQTCLAPFPLQKAIWVVRWATLGFSPVREKSTVVSCQANYTVDSFFPCTVQPWHTQTGYYSIFTVWLQCPLLPLGRYCRLESFLQVLFYQYPLEYNFNFSPPRGTLVWVWAHSPKCALIITEICSWYFFFFCSRFTLWNKRCRLIVSISRSRGGTPWTVFFVPDVFIAG